MAAHASAALANNRIFFIGLPSQGLRLIRFRSALDSQ